MREIEVGEVWILELGAVVDWCCCLAILVWFSCLNYMVAYPSISIRFR